MQENTIIFIILQITSRLFSPEIELSEENISEYRSILEKIASDASNKPLLFGEPIHPPNQNNSSRLDKILKHLNSQYNINYIIQFKDEVIGYASIWDGWNPHENEYGGSVVELAFIDPKYSSQIPFVRRKLTEIKSK